MFDKLDEASLSLAMDYLQVAAWLAGFISARNQFDVSTDGNLTKGTDTKDWMNWIFSYCRQHPTSEIFTAALDFSNNLKASNKPN
ncbi:hypothetical protein [Methylocapsa palsarum]|nr:hypothetical protein [Methylocapsa palsarum]